MMIGEEIENYIEAIKIFQTIPDWADANEQIAVCQKKIEEIKVKEEAERLAAEKLEKKRKKIIAIITPIVCVCLAFAILLTEVIIPNGKYNDAIALMDEGKYDEAIAAFEALDGYKDSEEQIESCKTAIKDVAYADAVSLMNVGKYDEAITVFTELNEFKDSKIQLDNCYLKKYEEAYIKIRDIKIGDTYVFGNFEQDNNPNNGKEPIEWIVLEKRDLSLLLISKKALDCQQYAYDPSYANLTWEACSLRKWMNDTFLNAAFSAEEQKHIMCVPVSADKNPNYSTNSGKTTTDKIFLLSINEANEYFEGGESRMCVPTAYAIAKGAYVNGNYTKDDEATCWWWLRTTGSYQLRAAFVRSYGAVECSGDDVDNTGGCVRPALWISLDP